MMKTRTATLGGWLAVLVLPLLAVSAARAQTYYYPVYGPWGVYYVPYYPTNPIPQSRPASGIVRTSAAAPAYGAQTGGSEERPSYYSEDYAGPQGPRTEPSKVAYIRVRVPANAQLWINNDRRTQAGAMREFVTPALDPDHIYIYNVRARWTEEGGINVEKTLRVRTISGTRVTVNFVRPPAEQPRPAAPVAAAVAPSSSAPRVEQQPVDWTSGVAPRSFWGATRP